MYNAEIISTTINKGILSVEVKFSNNEDSFIDTIQTNQHQDSFWIGEQIERRLKHLNSLSQIKDSITLGTYQPSPVTKTEKQFYDEETIRYHNYMNKARLGVIGYDHPVIAKLLKWLRDNFKDEYLDQ